MNQMEMHYLPVCAYSTLTTHTHTHTNATYVMKVGEEEVKIKGEVGVKQDDNLGPILFI